MMQHTLKKLKEVAESEGAMSTYQALCDCEDELWEEYYYQKEHLAKVGFKHENSRMKFIKKLLGEQ